jgi:four helix bundle protein
MRDFHKLTVWQKSHEVTLAVYQTTGRFPQSELYGLSSQMRRAAASVPANIAEGAGRGSEKEFGRFLTIAAGSASELEYHLLLAHDLGYLDAETFEQLNSTTNEIKKMLNALIRKLKANR